MKKALSKRLQLSRETLLHLTEPGLRHVAGGRSNTCPQLCGSDANTVCFATCACTVLECGP